MKTFYFYPLKEVIKGLTKLANPSIQERLRHYLEEQDR